MLSRTADSLFWMARYMERAENMARLIAMGRRMEAIPTAENGRRDEWRAVLAAAGQANAFDAAALDRAATVDDETAGSEAGAEDAAETAGFTALDRTQVIQHMLLDRTNPSSVASCFENARANARATRGALTIEMWEAVNDAWIEMRRFGSRTIENGALSPLLDWIKQQSAHFRGAMDSTALRNDGFEFLRLGLFVERLDSTARLLDVRFVGLEPATGAGDGRDSVADHYAWTSLLRAAGVLRAYHAAYRADYDPKRIADFLVFDKQCPRSIAFCTDRVCGHLAALAELYGGRDSCHSLGDGLSALLKANRVEALFPQRMHDFISEIIRRNNALAVSVAEAYYFAPPPSEAASSTETAGAANGAAKTAEPLADRPAARGGGASKAPRSRASDGSPAAVSVG